MIKDPSIHYILNKIKATHGLTDIILADYWDADLYAVGIQKGDVLVYISTRKMPPHHYYVAIELETSKDLKTDIEIKDIAEEDLLKKLAEVFAKG